VQTALEERHKRLRGLSLACCRFEGPDFAAAYDLSSRYCSSLRVCTVCAVVRVCIQKPLQCFLVLSTSKPTRIAANLDTLQDPSRPYDGWKAREGPARPAGRRCVHGDQPRRDSQDAKVEHAQDAGQPPGSWVQKAKAYHRTSPPHTHTHARAHTHTHTHTHAAWMPAASTLRPRARARKVLSSP